MDTTLFNSIIDFLPDATFVIDKNGKVVAWNRSMEMMTGIKREDVFNKEGDFAYAIPFYGIKRPMLIDLVLNANQDIESYYDYVKKYNTSIYAEAFVPELNNGKGAYLWGIAAPLFDEDGNFQGVIESIRDITERKITEIRLKDSEEKLRTVFDQTFQFMSLLKTDGTVLVANKTFLEFLCTTNENFLGRFLWENPLWESSDKIKNTFKNAIKKATSGELVKFETVHTDKDCRLRYVDFLLKPVTDEEGNIIYLNLEGRDITEIKEKESALRESEEKYRAIFNAANDAIIIVDNETQTIFEVNDHMSKMFGYTREEVLKLSPKDLSALIFSDEEQGAPNVFYEVSEKSPRATEWIAKDKNGHKFLIEINMRRAMIGGHERLLITVRDIEERKRIEKQLEYEKQRFYTLTEEAPFGIVLFNSEGKYIYINAKFKEMFGYNLNDIPDGRTWFRKAYPDPEYRHSIIGIWLNDVEKFRKDPLTREGKQWTFTVTCKDNKQKFISFIVVQLPTGEYLLALEDITEQKMAEKELQKRKEELDIKSKNLEELNAALKVLLRERENDKIELESRILNNVKELVIPYIEKLKRSHLDANHMTYVDIIETNLNDIISPFLQKMGLKFSRLTPTEIEIANLIKQGKQTKDICKLLHMSKGAINFHRNNIRKKLGLNKEKVNLRSFLLSMA